jgi:spore coat polysaccharide biosynthesis protein SpsF (cytidylyltransferase family)
LEHVVQRVGFAHGIGNVIVATTVDPRDLKIVRLCAEKKIPVYVGSQEDVLDRYYQAARLFHADNVIRITSDCPVIDWEIIDRVICEHQTGESDYTSNTLQETFPDGLDVEIFTFSALFRAWKEATLKSQREHVTPYFRNHPELFKLKNVAHSENLGNKRWTLDQKEDYLFFKKVFHILYKKRKRFGLAEVLDFVRRHPDVEKMNSHIVRNEGYRRSLSQDISHE